MKRGSHAEKPYRRTNPARIAKRVRAWWRLTEPHHKTMGRTWYADAHAWAAGVAGETGLPLNVVCGVTSALSPGTSWRLNQKDTLALALAWRAKVPLETVKVASYGSQARKARDLLRFAETYGHWPDDTSIESLLGTRQAPKTKAFFRNLLRPDSSLAVTVDRHMARIAGIKLAEGASVFPRLYMAVADAIRSLAVEVGQPACEVQATLWLCYKDLADAWTGRSKNDRPEWASGGKEVAPF